MEGVHVPCSGGFIFLLFLLLSYDNDVGSTFYRWNFGSTLFNPVWFGFLTGHILFIKTCQLVMVTVLASLWHRVKLIEYEGFSPLTHSFIYSLLRGRWVKICGTVAVYHTSSTKFPFSQVFHAIPGYDIPQHCMVRLQKISCVTQFDII